MRTCFVKRQCKTGRKKIALTTFWAFAGKTAFKGCGVDHRLVPCGNGAVKGGMVDAVSIAPPVNSDEEEEPNHVNEMPVPGGGLEAEMFFRCEVAFGCAHPADEQEDCSNENVEAVETGRHEEGRGVDGVPKAHADMGKV